MVFSLDRRGKEKGRDKSQQKKFIIMSLDDITTKEIWDYLEVIYGVFPTTKREKMNTQGK